MLDYTQSLDEIRGRLDRLDQELRDLCIEKCGWGQNRTSFLIVSAGRGN
jgi:hypothetical protein